MTTPLTWFLLLSNLLVFGIELVLGGRFVDAYALWPLGPHFRPWQLVTSAFLHGSVIHLVTNMLGLWVFGREAERGIGTPRFLVLYTASVLSAAVAQIAVCLLLAQKTPTVGASGGLFGVLAAFAMLFPKRTVILLFPPIPLPARIFVLLYGAFELYAGVTGTQQGIAHFAHLGGLAGGYFTLRLWRGRARRSYG